VTWCPKFLSLRVDKQTYKYYLPRFLPRVPGWLRRQGGLASLCCTQGAG
jgi:hypothetical protein